jgi:hypothetical protein
MKTLAKVLLILNGILLALVASPVAAHSPISDWHAASWPSSDLIINWKFADGVPTGTALRARIKDGAQEWTNSSASQMNFSFDSGSDYASFPYNSCPSLSNAQKDAIHWGAFDGQGNTYGGTFKCSYYDAAGTPYSATTLHSFQIKFDQAENWNTSTSAPGTNQFDLWSGASHEFGHATGRGSTASRTAPGGDGHGHFPNSWAVCNETQSEHHTMCVSNRMDKTWDRSLNTHDLDTFNDAY